MGRTWIGQVRLLTRLTLLTYVPAGCLLVVLMLITRWAGISFSKLMYEPADLSNTPVYFGLLSNVGLFLWCAAATLCFFTCTISQRNPASKPLGSFLFFSGLFTLILLLDDYLMLHEYLFPTYLHVPEKVVMAAYGIVFLVYLVRFQRTIRSTDYVVLLSALGWFGCSVLVDQIEGFVMQRALLEDGTKLLGILGWLLYFARVSSQALTNKRTVDASQV